MFVSAMWCTCRMEGVYISAGVTLDGYVGPQLGVELLLLRRQAEPALSK
jgi:hypothetical protein